MLALKKPPEAGVNRASDNDVSEWAGSYERMASFR